jgi:hypothetical protein
LSWTSFLSSNDYFDNQHFKPHINQRFNEQLLDLINVTLQINSAIQ